MNPDNINELTQIMNHTKLTNEALTHDAIRAKQYIIGTFTPNLGVSFNSAPTVQYSTMQARAECRRLAKLYPGKTFFFVRFEGAEKTIAQPTAVTI